MRSALDRMSPYPSLPAGGTAGSGSCPFGANCSCAFSANRPLTTAQVVEAPQQAATSVRYWTDRGWRIVASNDSEVVLERYDSISFCVNALLCILTLGFWAIAWTKRNRQRRDDRKVLARRIAQAERERPRTSIALSLKPTDRLRVG